MEHQSSHQPLLRLGSPPTPCSRGRNGDQLPQEPCSRASVTGGGGRHHQSSCPRSWHSGWDQGLGHQDRAPWRLSTFPCCSELKMSPWEPTSSQGEEAGRGGQGGWWAQGQLTGLQRPRVTSRQRGRVGHQGRDTQTGPCRETKTETHTRMHRT